MTAANAGQAVEPYFATPGRGSRVVQRKRLPGGLWNVPVRSIR